MVTVGINVRSNNLLLTNHFTEVASDPSLYIPVEDVSGSVLDDAINTLISKSCPPVDCVCKQDTPWGICHLSVENFRVKPCIPEVFPDEGGKPCVAEQEPCGDCSKFVVVVLGWGWLLFLWLTFLFSFSSFRFVFYPLVIFLPHNGSLELG